MRLSGFSFISFFAIIFQCQAFAMIPNFAQVSPRDTAVRVDVLSIESGTDASALSSKIGFTIPYGLCSNSTVVSLNSSDPLLSDNSNHLTTMKTGSKQINPFHFYIFGSELPPAMFVQCLQLRLRDRGSITSSDLAASNFEMEFIPWLSPVLAVISDELRTGRTQPTLAMVELRLQRVLLPRSHKTLEELLPQNSLRRLAETKWLMKDEKFGTLDLKPNFELFRRRMQLLRETLGNDSYTIFSYREIPKNLLAQVNEVIDAITTETAAEFVSDFHRRALRSRSAIFFYLKLSQFFGLVSRFDTPTTGEMAYEQMKTLSHIAWDDFRIAREKKAVLVAGDRYKKELARTGKPKHFFMHTKARMENVETNSSEAH